MKLSFLVLLQKLCQLQKIDGENVQDGQVGTITRQLQQGFEKYIQSHSI